MRAKTDASGVIFTKEEMRGDEQRHGRVRRDVLDGGGATAHALGAGAS